MKEELALFSACADATRLRILHLLALRELCVCELVEVLAMPQGKISRHLGVLRRAGLVQSRREGTWMHYALSLSGNRLQRLVRDYLRGRAQSPVIAEDRQRLRQIGEMVCAPRRAR